MRFGIEICSCSVYTLVPTAFSTLQSSDSKRTQAILLKQHLLYNTGSNSQQASEPTKENIPFGGCFLLFWSPCGARCLHTLHQDSKSGVMFRQQAKRTSQGRENETATAGSLFLTESCRRSSPRYK